MKTRDLIRKAARNSATLVSNNDAKGTDSVNACM